MRMNAEMQVRSQQSTSSPKLQGFPGAGFNFSTLPLSYPPCGSSLHLACPCHGYLASQGPQCLPDLTVLQELPSPTDPTDSRARDAWGWPRPAPRSPSPSSPQLGLTSLCLALSDIPSNQIWAVAWSSGLASPVAGWEHPGRRREGCRGGRQQRCRLRARCLR